MRRNFISKTSRTKWAGLAWLAAMAGSATAITIQTVTVGDPGNSPDYSNTFLGNNYGSVSYVYNIGKYEVTLTEYTAFLNAVAAADTYALYNTEMANDKNIAGITRSGSSGSYTYAVTGDGNRPVTYVSWFDAARFTNWLHNGQPTGTQDVSTTESGAYALNGATTGVGFVKNGDATWWLPSESEWYKAAYYDPSASGPGDGYWDFATRSDTTPNSRNGSTSDPNSANFFRQVVDPQGYNGGYAVTQKPTQSSDQNYLTPVGAFSISTSYYGTLDQSGNVFEWIDAVLSTNKREVRGGAWNSFDPLLKASSRNEWAPETESDIIGFRVASAFSVPEPSISALVMMGLAGLVGGRRRKALLDCLPFA